MSWTKRQFIEEAYEEIGYASYDYDLQPEQFQSALRKLDAMMARWNSAGIRIGYPLVSTPSGSELSTETSVPDSAVEAIYTNLAVRIAPSLGKIVSPETKATADVGYKRLFALSTMPNEQQITELPRGAGAKAFDNINGPFLDDPVDPLQNGEDSTLDFYN